MSDRDDRTPPADVDSDAQTVAASSSGVHSDTYVSAAETIAAPSTAGGAFHGMTIAPGEEPVFPEVPGRYRPIDPHTGERVPDDDAAELARGGMGRVICVIDRNTSRPVVLKERIVHDDEEETSSGNTPESLSSADARFLHEAKITAQLEHPHIVPTYEIGRRESGALYYTMQRVKGRTLSAHLRECESLAERLEYLHHFLNLCNAIAFAHDKGVIHRDLKPDNVMVGQFGETIVLDWGLAKFVGASDLQVDRPLMNRLAKMKDGSARTLDGYAIGTPAYLPPEQAVGDLERIDPRSDVYSLGAVLYEILTGVPPFKGRNAQATLAAVLTEEPTPIRTLERKVPRELEAIARTAMSKDMDDRYLNAAELAADVERYLSGRFVPPPKGGLGTWLTYLWREKRPQLLWLAVALVAVVLGTLWHRQSTTALEREIAGLTHELDRAADRFGESAATRRQLTGTILGMQALERTGTPAALILAAEAFTLNPSAEHRALLYREATARPYALAEVGFAAPPGCRFVHGTGTDGRAPFCLTGARRLGTLDLVRHALTPLAELSFEARGVLATADGGFVAVDASGALHQLTPDGAVARTLALPDGVGMTLLGAAPEEPPGAVLAGRDGTLYRLDAQTGETTALATICEPDAATAPLVAVGARVDEATAVAAWCGGPAVRIGTLARRSYTTIADVPVGEAPVTALHVAGSTDQPAVFAGTAAGDLHRITRAVAAPDETRFAVETATVHGAAVRAIGAAADRVLTQDDDGVIKVWKDFATSLPDRPRRPTRLPDPALAFDGRRRVLTRAGDVLRLTDLRDQERPREVALPGMKSARLAGDAWHVLALAGTSGAPDVVRLAGDLAPGETRRWPAPLDSATEIWPLAQGGRALAVLADPAGNFALIDHEQQEDVGEPRRWAAEPISKVVADPFNVSLAVLTASGKVAIGNLSGTSPSYVWDKVPVEELTTTTDGIWLVLVDSYGAVWATRFADPALPVAPCTGGERAGKPATAGLPPRCLESPRARQLQFAAPLDKHRVLLVCTGRLLVYDIFAGRVVAAIQLGRFDRAWRHGMADYFLAGSAVEGGGWDYSLVPTASWLFEPPDKWIRKLQRAAGLMITDDEIALLPAPAWQD